MPIELCACGHENDHRGKPCHHEGCPCKEGIRIDVATFRMMANLHRVQSEQIGLAARTLAVLEALASVDSRLVSDANGRTRVEVKPRIEIVGA